MPQIVKRGVRQKPGGGQSRLPDLAVVVVAAEQRPPGRSAEYVVPSEPELLGVIEQGIAQERGHGHVTEKTRKSWEGQGPGDGR